jgi:cyclopropane-fatty-acyl-phospholipid synthase
MALAPLLFDALGGNLPVRVEMYDGSTAGPVDGVATLRVRSRQGLSRIITRPGELGVVRAYVSGDIDIDGDMLTMLEAGAASDFDLRTVDRLALIRLLRETGLGVLRAPPPPPEEVRLSGGLHTRHRDRAAVSHHYDVSNDFYRLVLGPSMIYSCAVWPDGANTLEDAQTAKLDLVCRKLGLEPGMRLLDVGCGWGSMVIHAARIYGVDAVGVTLSVEQAELARERVSDAGLADRIDIRVQDYRDIEDGPFDAISSIGMFEHVGRNRMDEYVRALFGLVCDRGRLLNHAISRPGCPQSDTVVGRGKAFARRLATATGSRVTSKIDSDLIERYVFPDGELHEVGVLVSMLQESGFEVRHLESLREHYALTLRAWVRNLEHGWDAAVAEVGEGRARVWRLYMAASAVNFELAGVSVEQVLAVKSPGGDSAMPLRPRF